MFTAIFSLFCNRNNKVLMIIYVSYFINNRIIIISILKYSHTFLMVVSLHWCLSLYVNSTPWEYFDRWLSIDIVAYLRPKTEVWLVWTILRKLRSYFFYDYIYLTRWTFILNEAIHHESLWNRFFDNSSTINW